MTTKTTDYTPVHPIKPGNPRKILVILLALALTVGVGFVSKMQANQSSVSSPTRYNVQTALDVPYYEGSDAHPIKHCLDIYHPEGLTNAPVLLFVHGGAWMSGDKSLYFYIGQAFASYGYTTVVVNYRLSPEVQHPTHVQDVARALAWVYRHIAGYGGDPERIALMGHSAGGHLVSLLALDPRYLRAEGLSPNLVQAVIPISGVYDLTSIPGFNAAFGSDFDARWDASPLAHVADQPSLPPFLVMYAQFDLPKLDEQAQTFYAKLQEHGAETQLAEILMRDHMTIVLLLGQEQDPTTQLSLQFLEAHLR